MVNQKNPRTVRRRHKTAGCEVSGFEEIPGRGVSFTAGEIVHRAKVGRLLRIRRMECFEKRNEIRCIYGHEGSVCDC